MSCNTHTRTHTHLKRFLNFDSVVRLRLCVVLRNVLKGAICTTQSKGSNIKEIQ